jgi:hypothetical protein
VRCRDLPMGPGGMFIGHVCQWPDGSVTNCPGASPLPTLPMCSPVYEQLPGNFWDHP